jgi:cytochrome b561
MGEPVGHRSDHYGGPEMALHWLSATLVVSLLGSGLVMTRLGAGSADQFAAYQLHKALGITLLLVTTVRYALRVTRQAPKDPPALPRAARVAARIVHRALYVALVTVPLFGWALVSVSTFNVPTSLFGLVTWPHLPVLPDLDRDLRVQLEPVLATWHKALAYGLAALVLLHSAAAIWHGRPVLARMVPGLASRSADT